MLHRKMLRRSNLCKLAKSLEVYMFFISVLVLASVLLAGLSAVIDG